MSSTSPCTTGCLRLTPTLLMHRRGTHTAPTLECVPDEEDAHSYDEDANEEYYNAEEDEEVGDQGKVLRGDAATEVGVNHLLWN
jgi:hypothetical protein